MRRDFEKAKMEDVSDCRATARRRMVKWMVRRDSAHRIGLGREVAQIVRHVAAEGETVLRDFKNAKIEDISDCRATARRRMVKRMVRRDSACGVGLGRCTQVGLW